MDKCTYTIRTKWEMILKNSDYNYELCIHKHSYNVYSHAACNVRVYYRYTHHN